VSGEDGGTGLARVQDPAGAPALRYPDDSFGMNGALPGAGPRAPRDIGVRTARRREAPANDDGRTCDTTDTGTGAAPPYGGENR